MKTVITSEDRSFIDFKELMSFSGLLKHLSLRDVLVRYKQTWMGFAWSIVRPMINIAIFGSLSLLVGNNNGVAGFIEVGAGIIFWQLISTIIADVSNALSTNANILTKVYFPKLILPASTLFGNVIDYLISFIIYFIILLIYSGGVPWQIVFLPFVIIYAICFSLSFGLFFSVSSVKYRDIKFILPYIIQVLFYVSPVFLSSTYVLGLNLPEWAKTLYQINPLVSILNAYKYCLLGPETVSLNFSYLAISLLYTIIQCYIAIRYFLKFEKTFADFI